MTTLIKNDPGPTPVDPATDEIRVKGVVLGDNAVAKITESSDEMFFEDVNNASPISLSTLASAGSSTPNVTEITVAQDVNLSSTSAIYLGDESTDGSFRIKLETGSLVVQQRQTGVWVDISTFTP